MSLKKKLIIGGFWSALAQIGAQGINFVLTIILARLLMPEDFGLLGMVSVIVGFWGYFSEFGFIACLIKEKDIDDYDCNTAFWTGIVFALLMYSAMFFIAPLVGWFYDCQELILIVRVLSLSIIIRSFTFVSVALEQRELKYKKLSTIKLCSLFVSGLIAIILAVSGFGVWSLIWQHISQESVLALGYCWLIKWRPRFIFSMTSFKKLVSFGVHVTSINLINFFSENIDYLLVGKLLGPEALGYYTMAFRLSRYPIEKIRVVFGHMLFPAFATMQTDLLRIKRNLIRVSVGVPLITIPFLCFMLLQTSSLVSLIIGEKWLSIVTLMKLFTLYLVGLSFSFGDESVLMVVGRIKQLSAMKFIMSLFLAVCGYFAVRYMGVVGMAMTYTFILVIYFILLKVMSLNAISMKWLEYAYSIHKVCVYGASILLLVLLFGISYGFSSTSGLILSGVGILIAMILLCLIYLKVLTLKPLRINVDGCIA